MAKANTLTDRTITIAQAIPLIEILIHAQRPVFLWASPGIGKSDVVHQLAKSFKPTVEEAKAGMLPGIAVDMRLGQMMPTDVMGIPFFNKNGNGGSGSMDWATPSILPSASLAAKHKIVILFLDELNTAAAAVQAAAYQLVLDRKTGSGYKLPANVAIVAAGNRESDRGVTTRMPTPLSNRFVHLKLRSNFDSWMDWAIDHDIHPDIVGYLNFSPQSLDMFNPTDPAHAFATPRTWAFVNDIMRSGEIAEVMLSELVAGTVGEGTAVGFMAHRKIAGMLPKPADVLDGKVTDLKTTEISAMFSLTISCCHLLKERVEVDKIDDKKLHKIVDTFFTYMMTNFQVEMNVLGARVLLQKYKIPLDPKQLKTWPEWLKKYSKFLTGIL